MRRDNNTDVVSGCAGAVFTNKDTTLSIDGNTAFFYNSASIYGGEHGEEYMYTSGPCMVYRSKCVHILRVKQHHIGF